MGYRDPHKDSWVLAAMSKEDFQYHLEGGDNEDINFSDDDCADMANTISSGLDLGDLIESVVMQKVEEIRSREK
ncbi:MAG: hypothetical protein KAS32_21270 [Candidatus Peribacteraceae bacterium]|nr:hypothetical protein [Candidatus Peribacteraceae bacterium]